LRFVFVTAYELLVFEDSSVVMASKLI
jgi:hypothetical protein